MTTQGIADQFSAFFYGCAEVVDAGCRFTVENIIGADTDTQKLLVKFAEGLYIIVNAFEKHSLVANVNAATEQVIYRF